MSDVDYLPDNYLVPIEDKLARKKEVAEQRRSALNPLQAIFVNHFFESNMDLRVSAERTGVKVAQAREWVESPGPVSELIGLRLREMSEASKVTVEALVEKLWEEGTRMPIDSEDRTVSHAARVAALSHLAKFKGMFDKGGSKRSAKITVNIDVGGDNVAIQGEV